MHKLSPATRPRVDARQTVSGVLLIVQRHRAAGSVNIGYWPQWNPSAGKRSQTSAADETCRSPIVRFQVISPSNNRYCRHTRRVRHMPRSRDATVRPIKRCRSAANINTTNKLTFYGNENKRLCLHGTTGFASNNDERTNKRPTGGSSSVVAVWNVLPHCRQ